MALFSLNQVTKAKMLGLNVRTEHHGGELVPAGDIKLQVDAMNSILLAFDPMLLRALYCRAIDGEQREIEGIPGACEFPNLRFPKLKSPIAWEMKATGYKLTFDYGIGGDSNLVLDGATVTKVLLTPKEGGTVSVGFTVQIGDLAEEDAGRLAMLVKHDVEIMLEPPEGSNPLPFDAEDVTPESALAASLED